MEKNRRLVTIFESNIKGNDLIIILLLNPFFNIYIYMCVCVCVCVCVCMYVRTYVCMYVCMYMDILHFRSISVNFIKPHSILSNSSQFWEE